MLSRLRAAHGVLAVHAVRQAYVNRIDIRVLADPIKRLVRVDRGFGDAIHRRILRALRVGMSCDERGDLRGLRACACSHEDVRNSTQPDGCIADRLVCSAVGVYWQVSACQSKSGELREFATIHGASPRARPITIAKAL